MRRLAVLCVVFTAIPFSLKAYLPSLYSVSSLLLIKTDSLGNIIWEKSYGGDEHIEICGNYVQQTSDGGYIVTGRGEKSYYGKNRVPVLKTDSLGDTIWTYTYSEGDYVYLAGFYAAEGSSGYVIGGDKYDPEKERAYAFKFVINQAGILTSPPVEPDEEKEFQYFRTDKGIYAGADFMAGTSDGGMILAGVTGRSYFLKKVDKSGKKEWWKRYKAGRYCKLRCCRETSDGGYILMGEQVGSTALIKTDSAGKTVWERRYQHVCGKYLLETADAYMAVGESYRYGERIPYEAIPDFRKIYRQLWMAKMDSEGGMLWEKNYPAQDSTHECWGTCIQQTSDRGFIITGCTDYRWIRL